VPRQRDQKPVQTRVQKVGSSPALGDAALAAFAPTGVAAPRNAVSHNAVSHNQSLGSLGEDAVAKWYVCRGFEIVARNWRFKRLGEIDIIAMRADLLVFCEVKTRATAQFGSGLEAITPAKARRMRLLGEAFRREHEISRSMASRYDVAAIAGSQFAMVVGAV
jgi:putative endonuclease